MDKLDSMRLFVRVATTGGFARAGVHAGITTAAVSRAITELESRLQARLINRTTRRMSLTDPGRRYLRHCEQILAQIDMAESEITDSAAQPSGRLRLHASTSFGQHYLTPLIAVYTQQFPDVSVDLVLSQRVPDLIEENFDLSITVAGQLKSSSLVSQRLGTVRAILCASAEYLARSGVPVDSAELRNHRCLQFAMPDMSCAPWVFDDPETELFIPPELAPFTVNVPEAMAEAIRAGMGIGILPIPTALRGLHDRTLRQVLPDFRLRANNVYALYSSRLYLDAKIRTLVEFLKAALPQMIEEHENELKSWTAVLNMHMPVGSRSLAPS
jgi:DNA-binding transcriptional LysR family regulator